MLLGAICPSQAQWEVEDGRVILLQGEASELSLRIMHSQRMEYSAEKLEEMEEWLGIAYGSKGVVHIDTRGLTLLDLARRVAEVVHLEEYSPVCNLHQRLEKIRGGGFNATK